MENHFDQIMVYMCPSDQIIMSAQGQGSSDSGSYLGVCQLRTCSLYRNSHQIGHLDSASGLWPLTQDGFSPSQAALPQALLRIQRNQSSCSEPLPSLNPLPSNRVGAWRGNDSTQEFTHFENLFHSRERQMDNLQQLQVIFEEAINNPAGTAATIAAIVAFNGGEAPSPLELSGVSAATLSLPPPAGAGLSAMRSTLVFNLLASHRSPPLPAAPVIAPPPVVVPTAQLLRQDLDLPLGSFF